MSDAVLTEVRGRVLLITLNRPDAMNAVNTDLAQALVAAFQELDNNDALSVGILTGAGRGFCAGMDLKAFAAGGPPQGFDKVLEDAARKPLIAAIEGFALAGGLEVALTCDILIASEGAKLGIPEAGVGLLAAGGALLRLPRRIPYGKAMELALTAEPIRAEEALALGLINEVTPKGGAVDAALALAERIAKNAPLSVVESKAVIQMQQGLTEEEFWQAQRSHTAVIFKSEDAMEGAVAFAQKRSPEWKGR